MLVLYNDINNNINKMEKYLKIVGSNLNLVN